MDREPFVETFVTSIYRAGLTAALETLSRPPGRRPAPELVAASEWYSSLSTDDRQAAQTAMRLVAHSVAFSVLAVLDGVRLTHAERYEVWAVGPDGERALVNPPDGPLLHEQFQVLTVEPDGSLVR